MKITKDVNIHLKLYFGTSFGISSECSFQVPTQIAFGRTLVSQCAPPLVSGWGWEIFPISSSPVGLGFSKNQGGVPIVGWDCFFQRGFGVSSMQKIFVQFISISFLMTKETNKRRAYDGYSKENIDKHVQLINRYQPAGKLRRVELRTPKIAMTTLVQGGVDVFDFWVGLPLQGGVQFFSVGLIPRCICL